MVGGKRGAGIALGGGGGGGISKAKEEESSSSGGGILSYLNPLSYVSGGTDSDKKDNDVAKMFHYGTDENVWDRETGLSKETKMRLKNLKSCIEYSRD